MTHDHPATDWTVSIFGMAVSVWQWATDGMSPLSVIVALSSLVLVALRIRESVDRRRLMNQFGTVNRSALRKIVDAMSTRPDDLKD